MQVPYFGKPSGTTDPKAADHGSQTGVTAPNPHAPRAMANRSAPLRTGARSMGMAVRVRVVDSFEWNFFWGPSTVVDRSFCYTAKE